MSNVTASHGDLPRPWPAPGPDAGWWHGAGPDAAPAEEPTGVPDRPLKPRHRGRAAPTTTTTVVTPPVWEPAEGDGRPDWPLTTLRAMRAGRRASDPRPTSGPVRRSRPPRHPLPGLVALVLLALLAAFFAWFSAEPLWLSLRHGTRGVATVGTCRVHGIAKRCADFTAERDRFVAGKVTLLGAGPVAPGGTVPARMVSPRGSAAYTGSAVWRGPPRPPGGLARGVGVPWVGRAFPPPRRRRPH